MYLTPGCEINYYSATGAYGEGFGSYRALTRPGSGHLSAPGTSSSGIEIQHELFPRVSVTAGYFHGTFHDLLFSDNRERRPGGLDAVQVFNPIDGSPMTIYDITATAKGRARDVLDTSSTNRNARCSTASG